MRSRAHYKAHPIHPALIPFPFAFLIGAFVFDVLGTIAARPALWTTAGHLTIAGLGAGVLAAIPGVIDYLHVVPPNSSAKRRATQHALGNVLAMACFAAAVLLRGEQWQATAPTLAFEAIGATALAYSGWLGGVLVTRNLISVDHRYAQAGKWQESTVAGRPGEPVVVAHVDDLKADQMKLLHVNGQRIVLARTAAGFQAFDDRCTHRGGSLAAGVLVDGTVQCLWHGSQFDVASGTVRCGPAKDPIRAYEVKETPDGRVLLVFPPG